MRKLFIFLCAAMIVLPVIAEDKRLLTEQEAVVLGQQACIEMGVPAEQLNYKHTATYHDNDGHWSVMFEAKPHESGIGFGWDFSHAFIDADREAKCIRGS